MMKFILNFIFFGILFYLIWLVFPEAFRTLVSWADHLVAYTKELIQALWTKYGPGPVYPPPPSSPTEPHGAWLLIPFLRQYFKYYE
jgi:hypothetical protein